MSNFETRRRASSRGQGSSGLHPLICHNPLHQTTESQVLVLIVAQVIKGQWFLNLRSNWQPWLGSRRWAFWGGLGTTVIDLTEIADGLQDNPSSSNLRLLQWEEPVGCTMEFSSCI